MILWDEGLQSDSVRVYTEDPSVLVTANRSDLQVLKNLPEASRAGVYILTGDNQRYVGQASASVWSRISTHDRSKEWWTQVIFFSRVDGHLDKSQLDYLEAKLIRQFADAGFEIDNSNGGNSSYIGPYQRGQAESLLSTVEAILSKDIGLDIFSRKTRPKRKALPMIPQVTEISSIEISPAEVPASVEENIPIDEEVVPKRIGVRLTSELAGTLEATSYRKLFFSYYDLAWRNSSSKIEGDAAAFKHLDITDTIAEKRIHLYRQFDEKYSLYVNYSKAAMLDGLNRVASTIGDSITIEEIF